MGSLIFCPLTWRPAPGTHLSILAPLFSCCAANTQTFPYCVERCATLMDLCTVPCSPGGKQPLHSKPRFAQSSNEKKILIIVSTWIANYPRSEGGLLGVLEEFERCCFPGLLMQRAKVLISVLEKVVFDVQSGLYTLPSFGPISIKLLLLRLPCAHCFTKHQLEKNSKTCGKHTCAVAVTFNLDVIDLSTLFDIRIKQEYFETTCPMYGKK